MCDVIVKEYRRKLVILLSPQDQIHSKNLNVLSTKSFGTVITWAEIVTFKSSVKK